MWLKLNLDGMNIWFRVQNYEPSVRDKWDSQWCEIDFSFRFGDIINYSKNSYDVLLSCEIEELKNYLDDCLQDKFDDKKELEFIEPDFKFVFYPKYRLIDNPNVIKAPANAIMDVCVDWKIYLWDGALTENYFSTELCRNDMLALRDYLKYVIGEYDWSSPQIQDLIANGTIVKYQ